LAASAPRRGVAQMPCQHPGGAGPTWQHLERAAGCEVGAGTGAQQTRFIRASLSHDRVYVAPISASLTTIPGNLAQASGEHAERGL
jgi:hypothetical protein